MELLLRRRQMMAQVNSAPFGWQEYPVECWGYGNISSHHYDGYYNLIYYIQPLLSPSIKVENNSAYNAAMFFYDSSLAVVGNDQSVTAGGIFEAPSGASYFTMWAWDRPPLSIVDNGDFKIYYEGTPYVKPTQKPIMTGSDYLWCVGNIYNASLSTYQNQVVRTYQPVQTSTMDIDLSNMTYNIKFEFYSSNYDHIRDLTFSAGQSYTDILSGYSDLAYYRIVMYDQPSPVYARTAPFEITFR